MLDPLPLPSLDDLPREIAFMLRRAPAAICYVDRNQRYRYVNERFGAWAGVKPSEAIGRHVPEIIGPRAWERVRPASERALSGRTASYESEVIGPDGARYWLRGNLVPDFDADGVRGYVIMVTDITRRKLAEDALQDERREYEERLQAQVSERTAQLRELQRRLVEAERLSAAERMTGALAHAVNNPLAALLGTVEMAQQGMLESSAALERTRAIARRIQDVVQGTMRMFRRGEMALRPEAPQQLLAQVARELASRAEERGVEIVCRAEPALPPVFADLRLLVSALCCIGENALQATPARGHVWLEAEPMHDGSMVRIRISDEGPGIPARLRTRVMEPFFTTKTGGTGLGLSIASGVIHGHGGNLRIEDRPGGGATVSVELLTTPRE
jgi:PAS domain S-box-containing protein